MAKSIKDLKDLRVLRVCACYRHSGPKGPEENQRRFFPSASDGEGNPLACACGMRGPKPYGERGIFSVRSAGACPPRSLTLCGKRPQPSDHGCLLLRPVHGEGQALALR